MKNEFQPNGLHGDSHHNHETENAISTRELETTDGLIRLFLPVGTDWLLRDEDDPSIQHYFYPDAINTFLKVVYEDGYKRGETGGVFEMFHENKVGVKDNSTYADPGQMHTLYLRHFGQLEEDMEQSGLDDVVSTLVRIKALVYLLRRQDIELEKELTFEDEFKALSAGITNGFNSIADSLVESEDYQGYGESLVDSDVMNDLNSLSVKSKALIRLKIANPQLNSIF